MQRKITISAGDDAIPDYHRTRLKQLKQSKNKHIQMYLVSLLFCTYKYPIGTLEFQNKCNRLKNTLIAKIYIFPSNFLHTRLFKADLVGLRRETSSQTSHILRFIFHSHSRAHLSVAESKKELKSQVLLSVKLKLNGTLHPNEHCGAIWSTPELMDCSLPLMWVGHFWHFDILRWSMPLKTKQAVQSFF